MSNKISELIKELAKEASPRYLYNTKDFIPGETPIFYSGPFWDSKEIESALMSFLTGKWVTQGEYSQRFQSAFSAKFNAKHSHFVNSGSSANLALVTALKKYYRWNNDSEIIVSPVGFPTTIAPIVQNGMKPVFVDIQMDSLNFNLVEIERKITENTVAIFVSPVLGNPPDMDWLLAIADHYKIKLIGDNCDSLGSRWNGRYITDYYDAWTTSFYPAHHITTGEGGMVSSNNEEIINLVRSISWWGRDCHCVGSANLMPCGTCGNRFDKWIPEYDGIVDHKYVFTNMGYNLKPLDLQGAIGLAQLEKFEEIHWKRRNSYEKISNLLEKYVSGIRIPHELNKAEASWFGVPIICLTPELKIKLQSFFEENKVQTRNYFAGNILIHPGYSHLDDYKKYPNANKALSNVFFLGTAPHYNDKIFTYIEKILKTPNRALLLI